VKKRLLIFIGLFFVLSLHAALAVENCTESDNGNNPTIDGTLKVYDDTTDGYFTSSDICRSHVDRYIVTEYYCNGLLSATQNYYCNSCDINTRTCYEADDVSSSFSYSESDSGQEYTVAGLVKITTTYIENSTETAISSGVTTTKADTCIPYGMYKGYLREYYLSAMEIKSEDIDCSNVGSGYVCSEGVCMPATKVSSAFLRTLDFKTSASTGAIVVLIIGIMGIATYRLLHQKKKNNTSKKLRNKR